MGEEPVAVYIEHEMLPIDANHLEETFKLFSMPWGTLERSFEFRMT